MNASPRRVRRRRGDAPVSEGRVADTGSDSYDHSLNSCNETVALRIGDTDKILAYYEGALKHFRQLNCRMVAKAFIKVIEPRKQARHPYNGGKPPAGSAPGTTGDPEKTKPEWWPPKVIHKEPDHLNKERMSLSPISNSFLFINNFLAERIELLLHIICKLGSHGINADKLKEVAGDTKRSLQHPSHVEIIFEILRVRKLEERYGRGEVSGNTRVCVIDRGPGSKKDEMEGSTDSPTVTDGEAGHIEEGVSTLSPSIEQPAGPPTTPVDEMSMPARSLTGNCTLPEPLTFESQQGRAFYAASPPYTDTVSQGTYSTPVKAEITSPHNVPVFEYQPQDLLPTSTPSQQCGGLPSPYDAWYAHSFHHMIFSPVNNRKPPSPQPLPRPSTPITIYGTTRPSASDGFPWTMAHGPYCL